jgi:N-acetylmuramoyl-L-alanine amidase
LYGEDAEIDAAVFGIASHKLTSAEDPARVIQAPSSKHGEAFAEPPRFIVVDFAAADFAQGVVGFLSGPDAPGSIHVLVDRDGTIYQMVPFDTVAFHAGRSEYRGVTGLNFHSIGVELLNNGQLKKAEDGRWMTWSDMVVPAERVFVVGDAGEGEEGWERYSEAQVAAVRGIVAALKQAYPSIEEVVTQAEISLGVKLGPGPAFPLDEVRQALR